MRAVAILALLVAFEAHAQATGDGDADGIPDALDNCVELANADQIDDDLDGFGNRCDADLNQSGLVNIGDFGLFRTCLLHAQNHEPFDLACDFDGSRTITALDARIFRSLYERKPGPSALNP